MLAAVLAGALFLDRAQRLVPVYAAAHDLPAGVPLGAGDLMVVRVRLPDEALRHYLRPSRDRPVAGRVLTAPLRGGTLAPAELLLASPRDADLVELPVPVEPGDMAQGLRPGDRVQLLAAYTEGARRRQAAVLLPSAWRSALNAAGSARSRSRSRPDRSAGWRAPYSGCCATIGWRCPVRGNVSTGALSWAFDSPALRGIRAYNVYNRSRVVL